MCPLKRCPPYCSSCIPCRNARSYCCRPRTDKNKRLVRSLTACMCRSDRNSDWRSSYRHCRLCRRSMNSCCHRRMSCRSGNNRSCTATLCTRRHHICPGSIPQASCNSQHSCRKRPRCPPHSFRCSGGSWPCNRPRHICLPLCSGRSSHCCMSCSSQPRPN